MQDLIYEYLKEDLEGNEFYYNSLPKKSVSLKLKIKSDLVLAGIPFFSRVFNLLDPNLNLDFLREYEGKNLKKGESISLNLPFNVAITGERLALNLLHRASSIATETNYYSSKVKNIKILDTRKTTPSLRFLEKYAVRIGGGYNHRFSQTDIFMIKDNHKKYFGGIKNALKFFNDMGQFYTPVVIEVHSFEEIKECLNLKVSHLMLDNFTPSEIKEAVKLKTENVTYEVSGGICRENFENYIIKGVDAISIGKITFSPTPVDMSLKVENV